MVGILKWIGFIVATWVAQATVAGVPIRVLDSASGGDSLQTAPLIQLARTPAQWEAVWNAHRGANASLGAGAAIAVPTPPDVDFSQAMVLAVFSGESDSPGRFVVSDTQNGATKDVIRLAFEPLATGSAIHLQTRPYTFLMLTRTSRPLDVQVARPDAQTGNPAWQTVASFPAYHPPVRIPLHPRNGG